MNTPLQCEQCGWHGDESEAKLPDVRPEEAEANNQICPKCEGELFEVLVEGVNYKIDADGIVQNIESDIEAQRGIDAFVNDEVFDWSAQSVYFQEAYKDEWFTQTRPPNYGDYVDFYFDEHLTQLYWNYEDQKKRAAVSVESALVKAAGLGLLAASGGAFVAAMVWG